MEDNKKLILPFDDYMSIGDEGLEKVKEDQDEETKKVLENGLKVADEINGDEHVKAFPEEIKILKNEKLILKEPTTDLNEDLADNDLRSFVYDVRDSLRSICDKYGADASDMTTAWNFFRTNYNFGDGDDYDESLEEALPRDLARAYKGSDAYQVGSGYSTYMNLPSKNNPNSRPYFDPQKANYTEITPEEAIALKKAGRAEEIRVIFDGQLVTFNEKGLQSSGKYMAKGSYQKDNGTWVDDTRQLTFNQIVKQADKIYLADELLGGDSELQAKRGERALNPESRYPDYSTRRSAKNLIGQEYDFVPGGNADYDTRISSADSVASLTKTLDKYKENVAYYADRLSKASEEWEREEAQQRFDRYTRLVHDMEIKIAKAKGRDKNLAARKRYMASEIDLMKPFEQFKELKDNVRRAQNELQNAKNNYDNFKSSGSSDTQWYKRQLENLNERLKDIMRDIARNEIALENEEDKSQAKLGEYAAKADAAQKALDQVQAEVDKFLGRIS